MSLPYACRICKLFLEEGNFNYVLDKRDGTTFLVCHLCKSDLDKTITGKLSKEKFGKLVEKRWEEGMLKINQEIEEAKMQGKQVGTISFGGKSSELIECCQLVEWFNNLEKEKRLPQRSMFLLVLDNLEKKGKICSKCLNFRDGLQGELKNERQ